MAQKFKSTVQFDTTVKLNAQTASRVLKTDSSGNLVSSTTTETELGYLSGVTSSIQTQLNDKVDDTEKGANNGVATLDSGGKVPVSQLPNSIMEFQGVWNASTNSPTLADGVGNTGDTYRVNVAGTQNLGSGAQTFVIGDWVMYDSGGVWRLAHSGADAVQSVNGQSGVVSLTTTNISEGTNLYFTDTRARTAAVTDAINNGVTNIAPSQNAVFDALALKLNLSGGTMAGDINMGGNTLRATGVNDLNLSSQAALNMSGGTVVAIATTDNTVTSDVTINTVDGDVNVDTGSIYLTTGAESGTGIRGQVRIDANFLSLTNHQIKAVSDPTDPQDAATKNYVDTAVNAISGDISLTSFSAANNQVAPANVTGFAFANGTTRSFKALVSVSIDATTDLFESFEIMGVQKASSWEISVSSVGDTSGVSFTITNAGQIQYTSTNEAGFVSSTIKFRAITTTI